MAYTDFTNFAQLKAEFGITYQRTLLFDKTKLVPIAPTDTLKTMLRRAQRFPLSSEKAKSETIIMPVLEDVWDTAEQQFTCFSGFTFDVDKDKKLNGRCDYIFSRTVDAIEITTPVFCIIEAKDRTVEEGLSQAFASMYAAQLFNESEQQPLRMVHGCVTNATSWLFLELDEQKNARIDLVKYNTETELPLILANFQRIIRSLLK